ncbi:MULTISPECIES: hypothetical protein [unclassified Cryobacterium]|uniref:hypothetical protein n=1 Tax=unclassified Cryobacterium TaxID=2649013 RepID=UPI000CE37C1B|nr:MULTISPECIES: hypothetical protein [unclassified Cryobacterium]
MSGYDPLPGDPTSVRSAATRYTLTADAVRESAAELRRLIASDDLGRSEAVSALVELSGDVAGRLEKLHGRYETAGSSLSAYADSLETAQTMARQAIDARDYAAGEAATAQSWADHYSDAASEATDPADQIDAQRLALAHESVVDDLTVQLAATLQNYHDAVALRDTAAAVAAERIATAIDQDGLNDSLWDNFSGWVAENAAVLTSIKNILGYLAAGLAILSLFFPLLIPFALAIAGATALLSLVLASTGQISWIEFGLDALTFASLGVAAIAGVALKGTMAALKSTRVAHLTGLGTSKNPLRSVTASFNGVLPSKVGTANKVVWYREVFSTKGVANAKASRVLNNARAGAGGPGDDLLVGLGKVNIGFQRVELAIPSLLKGANLALDQLGLPAQVLNPVMPDAIDNVLNAGASLDDWYKQVNDQATWRVGSSW